MTTLTTKDALDFLRRHQPMPPVREASKETFQAYEAARRHFQANPVPECIPLFLNSFANDAGAGIYQLVEDVLRQFPPELVLPHLRAALRSPHAGVRSWNAQIASLFPDYSLVEPLSALLHDEDATIRFFAVSALEDIGDPSIIPQMQAALDGETSDEVRGALAEAIAELRTAVGP